MRELTVRRLGRVRRSVGRSQWLTRNIGLPGLPRFGAQLKSLTLVNVYGVSWNSE